MVVSSECSFYEMIDSFSFILICAFGNMDLMRTLRPYQCDSKFCMYQQDDFEFVKA